MAEQNAPHSNVENGHPRNASPRARDWFWHPWYAKLWLGLATIFWAVILAVPGHLLPGAIVVPVGALLHPFVIVPVQGFGFFKEWIHYNFAAGDSDGTEQDSFSNFGRSGYPFRKMDPTDPTDSSYYWHPGNPMSEAWRNEHVRGIH